MTSDAKIGLLLGLGFIFLIAFIINGLPDFGERTGNSELTTRMVNLQSGTAGLATSQRRAGQLLASPPQTAAPQGPVAPAAQPDSELRFAISPPAAPPTLATGPDDADTSRQDDLGNAGRQQAAPQEKPLTTLTLPVTYVVTADDTLASIAKKFYGPEIGNKQISIETIFQANRKLLKSPHEIYQGQKLTIPLPPPQAAAQQAGTLSVFASEKFEQVKSIGSRLLNNSTGSEQNSLYVVKENDNLWRIAAELLGDGNRYREIVKLNAGALENENTLTVGMQLKLPTR